jgi:hypothetical protein
MIVALAGPGGAYTTGASLTRLERRAGIIRRPDPQQPGDAGGRVVVRMIAQTAEH